MVPKRLPLFAVVGLTALVATLVIFRPARLPPVSADDEAPEARPAGRHAPANAEESTGVSRELRDRLDGLSEAEQIAAIESLQGDEVRIHMPELRILLAGGPPPAVRRAILTVVASLRDSDSRGFLAEAIRHPDPATRAAALEALKQAPDEALTEDLVRCALDREEGARHLAVDALAKLKTEAGFETVVAALEDDREDAAHRIRALANLARYRSTPFEERSREIARRYQASPDGDFAKVAIEVERALVP